MGRTPRIALLVVAAACLVSGLAGGLARLGAPDLVRGAAGFHALLMIPGFLGTVIGLERAVALGSRLAFTAPLASGAGALLLLAGFAELGGALLIVAPLALLAASVAIVRRQAQPHTVLLAVTAAAGFVGNATYVSGGALDAAIAWWFAFLVLTIAAERLELTRLVRRPALARPLLVAAAASLLAAALATSFGRSESPAAYGVSLMFLAAWLVSFDIARNTVHASGLARYAACALLTGYAWLAFAGGAWAGLLPASRDATLHALALGFVFSMILAHGPVIVPAIARVRVRFTPFFYAPLALLHLSLALRAFGSDATRPLSGALNAAAIALYAATLILSMRKAGRD